MNIIKNKYDIAREWNDLGFYYDRDDEKLLWIIIGNKIGIGKFCNLLEQYANDTSKEKISSDKHFGPYSYLKFMTWDKPEIKKDAIAGRLEDFHILSEHIKVLLNKDLKSFEIGEEYSSENEYKLRFILMGDDFIPASADN